MTRWLANPWKGWILLASVVLWTSACATGASAVAASTYGEASLYRSATAHVGLPPDRAFDAAVKILRAHGDLRITDVEETDNRCNGVAGPQKLTFRVIESANGKSRLTLMVGGGNDPGANQALADELMHAICKGLEVTCE